MTKYTDTQLDKFWAFIDDIQWNYSKSSEEVKKDLMKRVPPHEIDTWRVMCIALAKDLYNLCEVEYIDKTRLHIATSNIVGFGKTQYMEAMADTDVVDSFYNKAQSVEEFINSLPLSDDYFQLN